MTPIQQAYRLGQELAKTAALYPSGQFAQYPEDIMESTSPLISADDRAAMLANYYGQQAGEEPLSEEEAKAHGQSAGRTIGGVAGGLGGGALGALLAQKNPLLGGLAGLGAGALGGMGLGHLAGGPSGLQGREAHIREIAEARALMDSPDRGNLMRQEVLENLAMADAYQKMQDRRAQMHTGNAILATSPYRYY